jgi:cytochrome c-type biogenesis protein CcmH/NrfG
MLMTIRERKGWIRGVFIVLILFFAGGFLLGGAGTGNNFSVSDLIGNGSSSSSSTSTGSVSSLEKQIKAHPKDGAAWAQLSEAYSTASEPDKALTAAEQAVKLRPANVSDKKALASLYQAKANSLNTQAQSVYTEAYDLQQSSPDSSPFDISSTSTSPLATAIQDPFTKSQADQISVQISTLEAQSQSIATQAISYNDKALAQYHDIVENHVGDAQSWLSYATTAEQVGNNKAALVGYQQFLKLVPSDPIAPQVKTKITSLKKTIAKAAAAAKASTSTSTTTTSTTTTGG